MNGAKLRNCKLKSLRGDFKLILSRNTKFVNCSFLFLGENNLLQLNNKKGVSEIKNTSFWLQHKGSSIILGDNFTMEGGQLSSNEGKVIRIGDDCMFSNNIDIRNGDSHAIRNKENGDRINPAEDVIIGNHVWLCAYTKILKGSVIPDNCIIGNSSLVTSKFSEENVAYAGIPAKKVKSDISWTRWL